MFISISHPKSQPLILVAAFTVAMAAFAVTPADAASKAKNKHTVYVVDQVEGTPGAHAAPAAPAPEPAKETRTAAETTADKHRMQVNTGDTETASFQEFYPFPEPKAEVREEAVSSNKTLYWVGGAGAALVAGVAAWFIFSGGPESEPEPTAFAVH